jgi:hypothetical protein
MMFRQSSVFEFKNGSHTCLFYRSEKQLMHILTPFVLDGLKGEERVFCVQKPDILRKLLYDLRFLGIETDKEIERGALELHTEEEIYFPKTRFEPEVMMDMLKRAIAEARNRGFKSFRSAGELSWAVDGRNDCDKVVGYEKLVDEYYPGKPAIGLCQYDVNQFPVEVLRDVVDSHRMQLSETTADSHHASLCMKNGRWDAEVVADKLARKPRYYYVVRPQRSDAVVGWGVASNFDTAMANVDRLGERHETRMSSGVGSADRA